MKKMKCFANLIPGNLHVEIAIVNPGSSREEMRLADYHHRDRVRGAIFDISFSAALQRVSRAAHIGLFCTTTPGECQVSLLTFATD